MSRKLRDLYDGIVEQDEKKEKNDTYKFSISSEAALQQYLDEGKFAGREQQTSWIGAGCGRTD